MNRSTTSAGDGETDFRSSLLIQKGIRGQACLPRGIYGPATSSHFSALEVPVFLLCPIPARLMHENTHRTSLAVRTCLEVCSFTFILDGRLSVPKSCCFYLHQLRKGNNSTSISSITNANLPILAQPWAPHSVLVPLLLQCSDEADQRTDPS